MSRARDIADVIGVKLTSPIVQTDSIKDDSGTNLISRCLCGFLGPNRTNPKNLLGPNDKV